MALKDPVIFTTTFESMRFNLYWPFLKFRASFEKMANGLAVIHHGYKRKSRRHLDWLRFYLKNETLVTPRGSWPSRPKYCQFEHNHFSETTSTYFLKNTIKIIKPRELEFCQKFWSVSLYDLIIHPLTRLYLTDSEHYFVGEILILKLGPISNERYENSTFYDRNGFALPRIWKNNG